MMLDFAQCALRIIQTERNAYGTK